MECNIKLNYKKVNLKIFNLYAIFLNPILSTTLKWDKILLLLPILESALKKTRPRSHCFV